MEQAEKEIIEKIKANLIKLPFHAKYWRIKKERNLKNVIVCCEYNSRTYKSTKYYKPLSFIPNDKE